MKHPIFTGSAVAIVTPFKDGGVDFETLGELLDFQLENGTDAVVVCGTTGEASAMTYQERSEAVAFCVRHVGGRVPVIAGSGSNSTENAVTLSREAERRGADALLVVTPYYNKATQAGLLRHYRTIADAVSLPIILYNVPSRTGVSVAPETYAALAEHPNIAGVKEASGNLGNIQRTRALCPKDFTIWSGNDDETVPICALGGKDFCDTMFCEVNPIPVKTALSLLGWRVGALRSPMCPPAPENLERIKTALSQYGLVV